MVEVSGRGGQEGQPPPAAPGDAGGGVDEIAISAVAARQRGHATAAQLRDAGLGDTGISRRARRGRLHRRHRGVYAVGHAAKARFFDEAAALLAGGEGAFLSHRAAAVVWGLLPPRPADAIHITVTTPRPHRRGIRVHRTRRITPEDVTRRHDLPVTSVARTLLDLAESESRHTLERAYNEALALGLVRPRQVEDLLDRSPGRRGSKRLRQLIDPHAGFTRNQAERTLKQVARGAGLPSAEHNVVVHGYEMDAYYREHGVNVEVDGYSPHSSPRKFESDRRRDAELQTVHGIRVLRFSWTTLRDEPATVAAQIAAALARATSPGTRRA